MGLFAWRVEVAMADTKSPTVSGAWSQDWTWCLTVAPHGLASGDRSWDVGINGIAGNEERAKQKALDALERVVAAFSGFAG